MLKEKEFRLVMDDHENIVNDEPQRFPEAAQDGDAYRQGDVYIIRRDSVPGDCSESDVVLQLAPGTTKGSRHILNSSYGLKMFQRNSPTDLQGPILEVGEELVVTHPEHGDIVLCPGVYEITYQRAYAEELRRVRD